LCEVEEVFVLAFRRVMSRRKLCILGKELSTFRLCGSGATVSFPCLLSAVSAIGRRDHFNVVLLANCSFQCGRVVSLVADQPFGKLVEEISKQESFPSMALGMRSAFDRCSESKTVASCNSDEVRALATPRGPTAKPPFLMLAKVASTNASSRFSLLLVQVLGQKPQSLDELAVAYRLLESAMADLVWRLLTRHLGPLHSSAEQPQCPVCVPRGRKTPLQQLSLFVCHFPNGRHSRPSAESP
jgi:hypothetical protein